MHECMETRWWGLLSATLAAFFLSACAGREPLVEQPPEKAKIIFSVGYDAISEKYIEPKTVRALALAGLEGISDVDPTLTIEEHGGLLWLVQNGHLLRVGVTPRPQSLENWTALSADFLATSLANRSPEAKADAATFTTAMFNRVLGSLDTHSRYASEQAAIRHREKRRGYSGVGLHINQFEDSFIVTKVIPKSPAEKAGIQVSDEVLKIGNTPANQIKLEDLPNWLRGPAYSKISLVLKRRNLPSPIEVTLNRKQVFTSTVHYERHNAIAYFRLSGFNRDTARSLSNHLAWIGAEQKAPFHGIVLDLRGNPGGLMDQAIPVADLFLRSGRIVSTRGRHPNSSHTYNAIASDISTVLPIVVLLNGKSASSAEIVAAALHDQARALVVGSRSYGKGSVQTILPLPNGAEITLTWSHLYTPDGKPLNIAGVEPDICTVGLSKTGANPKKILASLTKTQKPGSCPALQVESPLDLPLAEEILENTALYASLFKEAPEEIAHKEIPSED